MEIIFLVSLIFFVAALVYMWLMVREAAHTTVDDAFESLVGYDEEDDSSSPAFEFNNLGTSAIFIGMRIITTAIIFFIVMLIFRGIVFMMGVTKGGTFAEFVMVHATPNLGTLVRIRNDPVFVFTNIAYNFKYTMTATVLSILAVYMYSKIGIMEEDKRNRAACHMHIDVIMFIILSVFISISIDISRKYLSN